LQAISQWDQSDYPVVCAAAFLGDVRLIDNLEL
jgi:pantothenate synthetase